jgi:hypothetical protein
MRPFKATMTGDYYIFVYTDPRIRDRNGNCQRFHEGLGLGIPKDVHLFEVARPEVADRAHAIRAAGMAPNFQVLLLGLSKGAALEVVAALRRHDESDERSAAE